MSTIHNTHLDLERELDLAPERYEIHADPLALGFGPLDRREFLRTLGGGLIVFCLLRETPAEAQDRRGGRGGGGNVPRQVGAWIHIAEDGTITAYTGKVEVGQNIRTSLAQAVADELRVPVDSVKMVMGDTARVPFDAGTFGSRSTPSMAPQLRRAAVAARRILIGLAAEQLEVDRESVVVEGGQVKHSRSNRSIGFGELTQGQELTGTIDEAEDGVTPADQWKAAGHSVPKVDGRNFVTGKHQFTSDMTLPGLVHGKILRAPSYGAKLNQVDTSSARAMSGVVVVQEGDFVGITAPDSYTADQALRALKADWDEPEGEPGPSDRDVYDFFRASRNESANRGAREIDRALEEADAVVEARYTIAYIAHAPLEPRAAVADWEDDRLTVWTGTQRPFGVRAELAREFNIPEDRVRVIVPDTGSGYGGKHTGEAAIEAARLSKSVGKPVKLVWTREEEFTWAYFRPGGLIEARAGASKDGQLLAWDFHNYNSGGSAIDPPYEIAQRNTAFHRVDSPLRQGSYRALAATANHFARETLIDELADKLEIDPLEFRLKNLRNDRMRAVLETAADRFGWDRSEAGEGRGIGLACGFDKGGYIATAAEVSVERVRGRDEVKVVRALTVFECGAVVNPDHLRNQIEGSMVMGLGGALFEAIQFARGRIRNGRFSRYRVPRFGDTPKIEVVLLDRKDLPSAGGSETPIVGIAPAVANAIFQASGVRLRSLPLVPDGLRG